MREEVMKQWEEMNPERPELREEVKEKKENYPTFTLKKWSLKSEAVKGEHTLWKLNER